MIHRSWNQRLEKRVAPPLLLGVVLPVPMTLCYAGLEFLVPKGGKHSSAPSTERHNGPNELELETATWPLRALPPSASTGKEGNYFTDRYDCSSLPRGN